MNLFTFCIVASDERFEMCAFPSIRKKKKSWESLRHLCPSAVAVVLQWEAAVAVWAEHDERLFLFLFPPPFSPLNYSPPRPLGASQDILRWNQWCVQTLNGTQTHPSQNRWGKGDRRHRRQSSGTWWRRTRARAHKEWPDRLMGFW